MHPAAPPSSTYGFGDFVLDLQTGELRKNGIKLKIHGQPVQILEMLLERPGQLITREELQKKLWPSDTFVDFETSLNAAVRRLREALNDSADKPRYVETLARRGYRFIGEVERVEEPSAEHHGRSEARYVWIGAVSLALALAGLAGLAVYAFRQRAGVDASRSPIRSLAILPLENLTGDPAQEYFADGMTDALITELAQVHGLKVISRTSVMHYKGAKKTLPEIARDLNVDAVVEGTVGRSGNEVKITAQLIRASTDTHLWAASYARVQQDVLRLQSEVAQDVTRQISEQLVPVERRSGPKPEVNPEAYDAYLKGVFFLNKESPAEVRSAVRYFKGALEKDGNFAAAYSGLASCYVSLAFMTEMTSGEAYAAAKGAAEKAVSLDDNLDQAHTALAWTSLWAWDWAKAETEFARAIQLNPNSESAHIGHFHLLLVLGKTDESIQEESTVRLLDPLSANSLSVGLSSAYHRRRYEDGIVKARTAIELYPQVSIFHVLLSNMYAAQGKDELAVEEMLVAEEIDGCSPDRLATLRGAFKTAGPNGLRRKRIELNKVLAAKQSMTAYDIAIDYAALGDGDQAITWLGRALEVRDPKASLIGVEPIFDGIRSKPGFVGFLRRMKLDPRPS